jgi:hypothetical protein
VLIDLGLTRLPSVSTWSSDGVVREDPRYAGGQSHREFMNTGDDVGSNRGVVLDSCRDRHPGGRTTASAVSVLAVASGSIVAGPRRLSVRLDAEVVERLRPDLAGAAGEAPQAYAW